MKPKPRPELSQLNLFQAQFEQLLNHDHPLFVLADQIDWHRFDVALADYDCPDIGAPDKAIRLLVGLHYLKHTFDVSDESLLERWVENPYWQHFCGFETMQHDVPLHSTSLTKWRQRVGAQKLAEMLTETIALALRGRICRSCCVRLRTRSFLGSQVFCQKRNTRKYRDRCLCWQCETPPRPKLTTRHIREVVEVRFVL